MNKPISLTLVMCSSLLGYLVCGLMNVKPKNRRSKD